MPIEPGSRIGPYEVTSHLGEGAMGVVFRAHDTKLQRDVALKLLPENFAKEPERLSRFQREAQLLASLNHPNIAHIYGLEEVDGSGCIVMELVEGETISERLKRAGPFPIDEAVSVAKQIAEALAAAHERGIVHRDLKPANIKLTPNGTVKVLDFGLAKALGAKSQDINVSSLPTLASGSIAGSIVGTIGYMSPEQARGREVDARSDIWAFGCVLYEMLTARLAFEGETATDVMARIVSGQPDLGLLPKETPPGIRLLLAATLNKNPQQRLQHIGDMHLFLDETFFPSRTASGERRVSSSWGKLLIAALALILIIGMIPVVLVLRRAPADSPAMRFEMSLPGLIGIPVAAPDGRRIAFVAQSSEGQRTLWVRGIGDEAAQQLHGTENVTGMLWSPDSRYLAFASDGKLRKIDSSGSSSPQAIFDLTGAQGATWNRDGVVLWGRNSDHVLVRVSDSGGEIKPVTALDATRKEIQHGFPVFLPDGSHFLYGALSSVPENSGIFVGSLDGKTAPNRIMTTSLFRTGGLGYEQGYLLFETDGKLTAQRFDEKALKLEGEPVLIAEGLEGGFSASSTGILMYRKAVADAANKQLTWFDRTGKQLGEVGTAANYGGIELSPDGERVAVDITSNGNKDIWIMDLARAIPTRVTFDPAVDWSAKWSPDGSHIVFASGGRAGNKPTQIYQKASTGVGNDEVLSGDGQPAIPVDWSSDGKYIVFSRTKPNGVGNDTWLQPMFGDRKPKPFLESQFDKVLAQVSPDGRWVAYTTNESGSFQIFVQSFPDPTGGKWQISAEGGVEPKWRRDGRELYYIAFDGKLMAVPVKVDRTFEAGKPMALFQTGLAVNRTRPDRDRRYDVSKDDRFLFVTPGKVTTPPVTVLVNWPSTLK